jgi:RNA polymerase sigma-70 factor (ECF subfamily)
MTTGGEPDATQPTSLSLLRRVKENDGAAWSRFVNLYSPLVYSWCRRAGVPEADAPDVGQEVFAAVARAIGAFEPDPGRGTFRGWLWTVTQRKAREFARRRAGQPCAAGGNAAHTTFLELTARPLAEAREEEAEAEALYRRAIEMVRAEFEDRTWVAFWRVTVHGARPAEVAADLGMTLPALYVAKSRVLARLREEFAGLVEFDVGAAPSGGSRPDPPREAHHASD